MYECGRIQTKISIRYLLPGSNDCYRWVGNDRPFKIAKNDEFFAVNSALPNNNFSHSSPTPFYLKNFSTFHCTLGCLFIKKTLSFNQSDILGYKGLIISKFYSRTQITTLFFNALIFNKFLCPTRYCYIAKIGISCLIVLLAKRFYSSSDHKIRYLTSKINSRHFCGIICFKLHDIYVQYNIFWWHRPSFYKRDRQLIQILVTSYSLPAYT